MKKFIVIAVIALAAFVGVHCFAHDTVVDSPYSSITVTVQDGTKELITVNGDFCVKIFSLLPVKNKTEMLTEWQKFYKGQKGGIYMGVNYTFDDKVTLKYGKYVVTVTNLDLNQVSNIMQSCL